jgi:2'-5' RNA ligase
MPFLLDLPARLKNEGWRVKIRQKERVEPPHVTIIRKTEYWRYGLRTPGFLDTEPDPRSVPQEVIDTIKANLTLLREQWDQMYPHNPIASEAEDE